MLLIYCLLYFYKVLLFYIINYHVLLFYTSLLLILLKLVSKINNIANNKLIHIYKVIIFSGTVFLLFIMVYWTSLNFFFINIFSKYIVNIIILTLNGWNF